MTYKQLSKKASGILPDGNVKKLITGVTNLDVGMFPKNESKYTMSGQMLKGIDFGYDFGFFESGTIVGKTEYVGRDGNIDQYTCYSEKLGFRPAKDQKIALLYYGYTVDRKMYGNDPFFKDASISTPTFFEPTHIVSLNYSGELMHNVKINAESATSFKNTEQTTVTYSSITEKTAIHLSAESNIPNTSVFIESAYDKTGKYFENATLPMAFGGTEQIRIAGKSDFLKSKIILAIEYSRLNQTNFSSSSSNQKWGFDVKTNFKLYPNLALSYKPFTTIRSFSDTLNIPQRPMLGSLWTGKASYQIKKHEQSVRFMLLYTQSRTELNYTEYSNSVGQFSITYLDKQRSATITSGINQSSGDNINTVFSPRNTGFLSSGGSVQVNKKMTTSGGIDFAWASFGLCRFGTNGSIAYKPGRIPVTLKFNLRFNDIKVIHNENWRQFYSCNFDIVYRFKSQTGK